MKVSIAMLQHAANAIFDHLQKEGHTEIELTEDHYWSIPDDKLYDMYKEPTGFTSGQISSDAQELDRIAAGKAAPIAYALVWLSSVVRLVGSRIVS
jgi:hypothetical protein